MTKFVIQVFFFQNALVEYIGVYSDTNKQLEGALWQENRGG